LELPLNVVNAFALKGEENFPRQNEPVCAEGGVRIFRFEKLIARLERSEGQNGNLRHAGDIPREIQEEPSRACAVA